MKAGKLPDILTPSRKIDVTAQSEFEQMQPIPHHSSEHGSDLLLSEQFQRPPLDDEIAVQFQCIPFAKLYISQRADLSVLEVEDNNVWDVGTLLVFECTVGRSNNGSKRISHALI
jgi:hypothetical protein